MASTFFLISTNFSRREVYAPGQIGVGENEMVEDDEDFPTAYLLFVIAAIIAIGVTAAGAFILLIRN